VPWQQEIAEHEIEAVAGQPREAALGIRGDLHVEARVLEDQGELLGLGGAVFDDEYARHGWLVPPLVAQALRPPPSATRDAAMAGSGSTRATRPAAAAAPRIPEDSEGASPRAGPPPPPPGARWQASPPAPPP